MGYLKNQILSELSFEQEDYLLESALENYREEKEAKQESCFDEWVTFNITDLKEDFVGEENEFNDFCLEMYKEECADLC